MTELSRLESIAASKRAEIANAQATTPLDIVRVQAQREAPPRDFLGALRGNRVAVIAEIKRASPATGVISRGLDVRTLARRYVAGGAKAIAIWTDAPFFHGHADLVREARAAVSVPILRKDFILEPYQIFESRAMGADAVLLIAALLNVATLRALIDLGAEMGMAAPVSVHREVDVDRAVAAGAEAMFIHNRDVDTLEVDLGKTQRFRPRIPPGVLVVSESGIATPADIARVQHDVDAVLVGTALMTSADAEQAVRVLVQAGARR